jgi:hypothetical protein
VSEFVPSHRRTTSSRTPGRVNEGTVQVELRRLEVCPFCNGLWFGGDLHGVHFDSAGRRVDCVGRVVGADGIARSLNQLPEVRR